MDWSLHKRDLPIAHFTAQPVQLRKIFCRLGRTGLCASACGHMTPRNFGLKSPVVCCITNSIQRYETMFEVKSNAPGKAAITPLCISTAAKLCHVQQTKADEVARALYVTLSQQQLKSCDICTMLNMEIQGRHLATRLPKRCLQLGFASH
jgi:hypothetical protein